LNSLPVSRSSMQKKVSQTNLPVAETAALPVRITTTEDRPRERCTPLFVLHAAKKPKFRLNQAAINQSTAKSVLRKEDNSRHKPAGLTGGFIFCLIIQAVRKNGNNNRENTFIKNSLKIICLFLMLMPFV